MIAIVIVSVLAGSQSPSFSSAQDLQDWFTYYYLRPRPELTLASIPILEAELMARKGESLEEEAGRGGVRTFYAKILKRNPKVVREFSGALASWPAPRRAFAREALRRCGTAACLRAIGASTVPSTRTARATPVTADTLDDSWAAFCATGSNNDVLEVIKVLPLVELGDDAGHLALGGAAKWSLESNAAQHQRVLALCEKQAAAATEPTRHLLLEIVRKAKAERANTPSMEPR